MPKLGYDSKGEFQRAMFSSLVHDYFKGGNLSGRNPNVDFEIERILLGLSKVWDAAEEHPAD